MRASWLWILWAALAGALVLAAAPRLDATQVGAKGIAQASFQDRPELQKRVTKRFANATLAEVLAWLSLERLSFVADVGAFPDRKITISVVEQPLGAVLDVIAEAFGGHWEAKGEIWTLKPGGKAQATTRELVVDSRVGGKSIAGANTRLEVLDQQAKDPLSRAKSEAASATSPAVGSQGEAREAKETAERREQARKALAEAREQLRRALDMLRQRKPEEAERQILEDIQKQVRDILDKLSHAIESQGTFKEKLFDKGFLDRPMQFDLRQKITGDAKALFERFKVPEKLELPEFGKLEGARIFQFGGQDLSRLLDSLTEEQKAKMSKQGYLTPRDLDEKQRSLLGKLPEGEWEITFVRDGKKLTLRSGG